MRWLLTYPEDGPSVPFYEAWVRSCGATPLLLASDFEHPGDLSTFDALLLSGGGDVDPARYGAATRHPATYDVLPHRDAVEIRLIGEFLSMKRPVLGICRGLQMLNVYFGGGLIQHIPDRLSEQTESHGHHPSYAVRHPLVVDCSTRLGLALSSVSETNTAHHQAVDPDRLGFGLSVAARSGAGVIEALESSNSALRVSAVQWHPERLPSDHPASARLASYWRALVRG